jgi:predicted AlkP superfamily pyrophosphatase or phosphodiesterase
MNRLFLLAAVLALAGCGNPPQRKAASAVPERVLIVSIDGLRPDMLLRANAPVVRSLMSRGAFTFWARTTEVSVTLPSHTSMLTGVVPDRHGIWWNYDLPKRYVHYPYVPTLFELAKQHGYTTAMAVGKSKFVALAKPGTLDWVYIPENYAEGAQVAERAAEMIRWHQPQVMFVHFPDPDAAGHGSGWGSQKQVLAIEKADKALAIVLAALRDQRLMEKTVIILSADHGGAGYSHGGDDPRSRHIPWIISGPGIRQNVDLTTSSRLTVNTEDTFATACFVMNIQMDEDLDGKPVLQAFEQHEEEEDLMFETAASPTKSTETKTAVYQPPTPYLPYQAR